MDFLLVKWSSDHQSDDFLLVTLLTEEIPTVEKRKYLAYKIFKNWKCSFCKQCDETFDHMWTCESCASELDNIIQETKEFFEGACNSLLINADKDPIIDDKLVNKMTFWDRTYSEMKITFIDLIKGIISCELSAYTSLIFENQNLQEKFLVLLRNFIFEKVRVFGLIDV
ncbi:hypothetical protein GLOIN_2v1769807 [Rhizophagus irregularis DAOM 181602=DAOM 197198]|uniref:Uncharacterized protein n=1 Tax=Rhizophagus irregularis (strain DAOM 181602 / DAOM 197198 / MUCL 43194) TaxID=747089 RepID=A0A2P4QDR6_RHIID|nr:hypothetical protein GLOIN_2v1769807 [Rhizophagus irregularis DAOM 181602=DAOM 197198]POG75782.1 hypothetical protein GLOIN_2v1769807 [Rhizophagus irregularis DAOM 181602=DAOM 197198]GET67363.1 hypothetical protein GLOIN_2v1769807 [Rhizophagus irregularis DAOM 181602=DAOM 197198]|eukprot:XP_025182648.1 hypothetical protein GLOIN_2v1769807 [Rhizophagus irregularis DAOM 181602=DAOM 197198]